MILTILNVSTADINIKTKTNRNNSVGLFQFSVDASFLFRTGIDFLEPVRWPAERAELDEKIIMCYLDAGFVGRM